MADPHVWDVRGRRPPAGEDSSFQAEVAKFSGAYCASAPRLEVAKFSGTYCASAPRLEVAKFSGVHCASAPRLEVAKFRGAHCASAPTLEVAKFSGTHCASAPTLEVTKFSDTPPYTCSDGEGVLLGVDVFLFGTRGRCVPLWGSRSDANDERVQQAR